MSVFSWETDWKGSCGNFPLMETFCVLKWVMISLGVHLSKFTEIIPQSKTCKTKLSIVKEDSSGLHNSIKPWYTIHPLLSISLITVRILHLFVWLFDSHLSQFLDFQEEETRTNLFTTESPLPNTVFAIHGVFSD